MSRWLRIVLPALGLLAVNIVARFVVRFGFDNDAEAQDRISLVMFGVVALVIAVLAFRWARVRPLGVWLADLGAAAAIGCALTVLAAPLMFGGNPFAGGAGDFFAQIWLYAAFAIGGMLLGYLVAVMLGRDYRSQQLERVARGGGQRPRRRGATGPTRRVRP
jgi:hypothetical protein